MKKPEIKKLLFLLPSLLGVLAFFLLPLGYCALYAFSSTPGRFHFAGLQNFFSLFASQTFLLAFGNTALLMAAYILALLLFSLLTVYILDDSSGTMYFLMGLSVAMAVPSVLLVQVAREFPALYEESPPLLFLLLYLWKHIGLNSLILKAASREMDPQLLEAAAIDGAGKRQAFCHIQFFHLLPHLKFLFVFDIIGFFRIFRESYLLYGLYPPASFYLLPNFFFNNFENLNYQRLSTGAVIAILFLLLVNAIVLKAGERNEIV